MTVRVEFPTKGENVTGDIDQSRYGDCDTCGQTAGGACFDMRFGRYGRNYHTERPHTGRRILPQEDKRGRPPIGGEIRQELGDDLLKRVERWAVECGLNRANAIRTLLGRALDAEDS